MRSRRVGGWWVAMFGLVAALAFGGCGLEEETAVGPSVVTGWLVVNNLTAIDAEVLVDGQPVGPVAGNQTQTFEGPFAGDHQLHAVAKDGSAWWGPVDVSITKGSTHTWNLHDTPE